ncbi:hypothetical protein Zm00014a_017530 [Zea mays]|uniref:Uncharacterized protein n=1 Tax=Zea mays TaxID=4577 RepID=A0A317YES8_MAIZE|nr:hypothetical protein Zm00014a_017530 [Zea mays]
MGEYRKSIETCNKVLDTNPVHAKALYRRGMSYMLLGEFDDARNDFEKMITVDKSSEPDATAALLKLKQKEQEAEKKARKQFKGLFDKKPGEISEVGVESEGGKDAGDARGSGEATSADRGANAVDSPTRESEYAFEEERPGLLGRLWPSARRIFSSVGINRVPAGSQAEAEVTFCCSTQHCTYIHTDGVRGAFSGHHHRPRHWVQEVPRSRRQPHREDRAQPRVVHGHQRAAQGPGARELHRPRGRRAGRAWPTVPTAGVHRRLRPGTWDARSGASDSAPFWRQQWFT